MKNQVKLKSCTIILISILVIINLEIGNTQTILKMRDMVPIKYVLIMLVQMDPTATRMCDLINLH